ncbi:hypothetical protein [Pantoea sp. B65]|uniref:hypothetical protein n=1 Tax=Pantoea sp. B65 TaxID=2813359 RepID=UPI0039B417C0
MPKLPMILPVTSPSAVPSTVTSSIRPLFRQLINTSQSPATLTSAAGVAPLLHSTYRPAEAIAGPSGHCGISEEAWNELYADLQDLHHTAMQDKTETTGTDISSLLTPPVMAAESVPQQRDQAWYEALGAQLHLLTGITAEDLYMRLIFRYGRQAPALHVIHALLPPPAEQQIHPGPIADSDISPAASDPEASDSSTETSDSATDSPAHESQNPPSPQEITFSQRQLEWFTRVWLQIGKTSLIDKVRALVNVADAPLALTDENVYAALNQLQGQQAPSFQIIRNAIIERDAEVSNASLQWVETRLAEIRLESAESIVVWLLTRQDKPDDLKRSGIFKALQQLLGPRAPGMATVSCASAWAHTDIPPSYTRWFDEHKDKLRGDGKLDKLVALLQQGDTPEELTPAMLFKGMLLRLDADVPDGSIVRKAFILSGRSAPQPVAEWAWHWQETQGKSLQRLSALLARSDRPSGMTPKMLRSALLKQQDSSVPSQSIVNRAFILAGYGGDKQLDPWVASNWSAIQENVEWEKYRVEEKLLILMQMMPAELSSGLKASTLYAALVRQQDTKAPGKTSVTDAFALFRASMVLTDNLVTWVSNAMPANDGRSIEPRLVELLKKDRPTGLTPGTLQRALVQIWGQQQAPGLRVVHEAFIRAQPDIEVRPEVLQWVMNKIPAGEGPTPEQIKQLYHDPDRPPNVNAVILQAALEQHLHAEAPNLCAVRNAFSSKKYSRPQNRLALPPPHLSVPATEPAAKKPRSGSPTEEQYPHFIRRSVMPERAAKSGG